MASLEAKMAFQRLQTNGKECLIQMVPDGSCQKGPSLSICWAASATMVTSRSVGRPLMRKKSWALAVAAAAVMAAAAAVALSRLRSSSSSSRAPAIVF